MGRAYSNDLRERVVAAVERMGCPVAGGGAVWRWREHGDPVGGPFTEWQRGSGPDRRL